MLSGVREEMSSLSLTLHKRELELGFQWKVQWTWSSKFHCMILDSLAEEERTIHSNHLQL